MARIGYVYLSVNNQYVREQILAIQNTGVKQIVLNEVDITLLHSGDELIIYELKSLGKTIIQLATFIDRLNKKGIKLITLKKESFMDFISDNQLLSILFDLAELERFTISERTSKGIKLAKQSGRIGGRPKLSEEKVKHIKYLYKSRGYTLREIAEECEVSLGTAYKYVKDDHE